jgi:hypothetical protein
MEQNEFLEQYVFKGLKNANDTKDEKAPQHFSEKDFEEVLKRCEYFGIGIYTIESFFEGSSYGASVHEDFRKKATDAAWYEKAFSTFRLTQPGMTYMGTYKVSLKLLARY